MRATWIIAKKDLLLRIRDRSVLIIGVVAPLALAFIFNLVFGGAIGSGGGAIEFDYGVVNSDEGPVAAAFAETLDQIASGGPITITAHASAEDGRQAVDDGTIDALFVLPAGLSSQVAAGTSAEINVIGGVDSPTASGIAISIAERFSTELGTATLGAVTAAQGGTISVTDIPAAVAEAATQAPAAIVVDVAASTRQLDSATYFVAGLAIFFMFFIAGLGVTSMLEERRDGTMARLVAAPITRSSIIAGKALTSLLIGLGAMATLVIASTLLMGADWGPPLGVFLLVSAAIAAVVSLMSFVGGLARTAEQAGNLQSIVAVTFAMLGGTFVPISDASSFLGRLRFITPNAWFLQGLADISSGVVTDALPAIGVLMAIAVVGGVLAVVVSKKVVTI